MAKLDRIFHALADPTRRSVVERLCSGPATVSDLARPHRMALPSFLKHLGVLEAAGLVTSDKQGRVRWCRLRGGGLRPVAGWMADKRALWEGRTDRLADFVETETEK